jgi:two-component system phosphate regulon response regulator PhoB
MSTDAARILVVEDNADTSALLRDLLEAEGYDVASVATGEAAFEALAVTPDIDLVVLDLMLPGMSGYEVIERMRALPELADLPVLVLSALSSPSARVRGLREGADDYVGKPFDPSELLARIEAMIRRARRVGVRDHEGRVQVGDLTLDPVRQTVGVQGGAPVELTPTEYRLVAALASRPEEVLSRQDLAQMVWGYQDASIGRSIDVHVHRLRTKLQRAQERGAAHVERATVDPCSDAAPGERLEAFCAAA